MNENTRFVSTVPVPARVLVLRVLLLALVAPPVAAAAAPAAIGQGFTHGAPKTAVPGSLPPSGGDPWIPPDPFDPYAIPGGEEKVFGRTIAGRFNNDERLDVALLCDGEVLFLSNRDLYLSHATPWTGVIDMDTYPSGGPDGQDAVVFTDASGLHFGWWDFATHAFVRTELEGSAWVGAKLVRAMGVRGTLLPDVSGVSADGHTLLVMGVVAEILSPGVSGVSPNGDDGDMVLVMGVVPEITWVFAPVPGASFTVQDEILSFTAVEWNGSAPAEWAVLTTAPLRIYDSGGNPVDSWATAGMGGSLATLEQDYLPYERVAWLTGEVPSGDGVAQWLFAFDQTHVDPAVNVAGVTATSIAAGDWDRDGDDDVAIGHQASQMIYVASNERSSTVPEAISFPSGGSVELMVVGEPGAPNPGHVANPVMGDFDGDGDEDLATAVQASVEFRIAENSLVDDEVQEPVILDMGYEVTAEARHGEFWVVIDRNPGMTEPITDVRVTMWRQEVLGEPSDPTPEEDLIFPIAQWPCELTVLVPEQGHYFESVYYFEMRFLERDVAGDVVASYAASLGGLTLSPLIYDILAVVEDAGPKFEIVPEGELIFPPGGSGVLAGAYVPNLRVPESTGMNYE